MKICPKCNVTHEKVGRFCSRSCANSRGIRSSETKKKISKKLSGRKLSEKHIQNISGDNHPKRKGRNLPPIISVEKSCLKCGSNFTTKRYDQRYCSIICFNKRNTDNRTEFHNYRLECKFDFNVFDYPDEFDLSMIEEYGIYSASNRGNNLMGISRDHMVSVRYGFDNNILAEIISHPANCVLMQHKLNSSKKTKCSISIEELLIRIDKWNKKYMGTGPDGKGRDCKSQAVKN